MGQHYNVLAALRTLRRKDGSGVTLQKGHMFGRTDCHRLEH